MDTEAFIRWALDDARTLEERYSTELLVEQAEQTWNVRHMTGHYWRVEESMARKRERFLNPAYQPAYSETSVRRAAEILPETTQWGLSGGGWEERPVRDISVLRFLTSVEILGIGCEVSDISLVTELPRLRELTVSSPICEDFRPLARCTRLHALTLSLGVPWPEVDGLENLQQLETLALNGNLLVFQKGITFPRVRHGTLNCSPLQARSVRELPQLPACEFLTLSGVERLDGIENFPRLRNLILTGPVRDFSPLAALGGLTCLQHSGGFPVDVAPLTRLPGLLCAMFQTQHTYGLDKAPLRDYSRLAASPTLRELHVSGCPPLEMEVAALNAGLPPWDDLLLAPEPRPVPPLRIIIAPHLKHPRRDEPHRGPGEPELEDKAIRECEGRWVGRFATRLLSERLGHSDWGKVSASGSYRTLSARVECYEVVERLAEIVEALRDVIARLRHDYLACIWIALRVPPPKPTEAQAELYRRFRDEEEKADTERRMEERREQLERLYLYQLKQQEGKAVDPKEFKAPPPKPLPPAPWEVEEEDEEYDDNSGDIAVKKKPDPPPQFWDDDHPLADNYRFRATLTPGELWIDHRHAPLGLHLLGREADEEWPKEEKKP